MLMNTAGKQQYRAEADGDRAEGSGIPRHRSVMDSPVKRPLQSSTKPGSCLHYFNAIVTRGSNYLLLRLADGQYSSH